MDRLKPKFDLNEIIDIQIDYLKNTYPELEKRDDVKEIISIEAGNTIVQNECKNLAN